MSRIKILKFLAKLNFIFRFLCYASTQISLTNNKKKTFLFFSYDLWCLVRNSFLAFFFIDIAKLRRKKKHIFERLFTLSLIKLHYFCYSQQFIELLIETSSWIQKMSDRGNNNLWVKGIFFIRCPNTKKIQYFANRKKFKM